MSDTLFKRPKLKVRTHMLGSFISPLFTDFFPELKEMMDGVDPKSKNAQNSILNDFDFMAHQYDGSQFIKVKVEMIDKPPFTKYSFLDDESRTFAKQIANVTTIVNAVRDGVNTSFFPDLKTEKEEYKNPLWLKNTCNNFYFLPVNLLIDSDLEHI